MRLRFLWIDYYQEASQAAEKWHQVNVLPVPSLQDCIFSSFPCETLVSTQTICQLLEGKTHIVNIDSSTLHHLDIRRVQSQFLTIILPEKVACLWKTPWQTLITNKLFSERLLLYQERTREVELVKCFYEFESFAVDMTYQNNVAMTSLSELSSIVSRKPIQNVKQWEDQSPTECGKYLSIEDMVLQLEKESVRIQDKLYNNKKVDRDCSLSLQYSDLSCKAVNADFACQSRSKPNLLVLEVATVDEALCVSWTHECYWMEVKRLSVELFLNVDRISINNEQILDPEWMTLTLKEFLEPLRDKSNTILVDSAHDCDDSMWNLLDSEKFSENNHFLMFESPVTFWKDKNIVNFGQFFKQLSLSHQCIPLLETSDSTCHGQYEDLIVMPELVLADSSFTSLPVPCFKENEKQCIAMDVILEALSMCKHSVPGALNFLYLDWHLSQSKNCGKDSCNILESRVLKVEYCETATYNPSQFDNVNLDSTFNIYVEKKYPLEIEPVVSSPKRNGTRCSIQREIPVSTMKNICSLGTECSVRRELPASAIKENHSLGTECFEQREPLVYTPRQNCSLDSSNSVCPLTPSSDSKSSRIQCKASGVATKPMNHIYNEALCKEPNPGDTFACKDLTFFLQARQGNIKTPSSGNTSQKENPDSNKVSVAECLPNFQVHQVLLSKRILILKGFLELDYSRILEDDDLAFEVQKYKSLMKLSTENDAKKTLIMLIKERADKQALNEQQLLRSFIALYILQQTAENLCIYGILVGHLYMESWYLNLRFLQDLICLSYSELEEAYKQVEKGLLIDHPKLSCLREIIESHKSRHKNSKFLIVVERRAVFTMYKQIIACDLRPYQFDREENLLYGGVPVEYPDLINQAVSDAVVKCDCLIVPSEYITSSFPIQQFSCIIHYDESAANEERNLRYTSSMCSLEIHSFKISMNEDDSRTRAGEHNRCTQRGSLITQSGMISQEVLGEGNVKLQNGQSVNMSTSSIQNNAESERLHLDTSDHCIFGDATFFGMPPNGYKQCDMNIIVNTSQSYKHLLSCYRSSYEKILALEKDGVCVIERYLFLPIDLILSPTVCLILYTQEKVYEAKTMSSGTIQLSWIEDITNDSMKALSFSFTTCILIFEGAFDCIEEIILAFSNLYAAAIGLDIRLQCFISGGSVTTDLLISECINQVRRSQKRSSFPKMLEAKTYAEAFLTEFASINPLTAHAILSSGIGIKRFMSLSVEEQLHLTDAFDISEKSLQLLQKQWQNSGNSGKVFIESKSTNYQKNGGIVPGEPKIFDSEPRREKQYEMRNFEHHNRGKSNLLVDDFNLSKNDIIDALHEEWRFQKPQAKCEVGDFLANECGLWPPVARKGQDERKDHFRNHQPNMIYFNEEALQPIILPAHEHITTFAPPEHEIKLKKTMDLILKRAPPKSEKKSGIKDCYSYLSARKGFPKGQLHLASLSPEAEVENVHGNDSSVEGNTRLSLDEDSKTNSQDRSWHMFPFPTDFSHDLADDITEKPERSFLSHPVHRKAIGRDAFEHELEKEYSIKQSSKECPEEFANKRTPPKRRLEFDFPATVKKHQRGGHPTKGKEYLKPGLFDKYRYEVEETKQFGRGGIHYVDNEKHIGKKAPIKCPKKLPIGSIGHGWRNKYSKSPIYYSQPRHRQHDEDDDTTQTRELCPSWTPHDKRSKKVLSFAKRGNDGQSQLVWQSSSERRHWK